MKRILIAIAVLSAVSLGFFGCVFFMPETYFLADSGSCIEYTTADFDTKLLVQIVGFEKGECPTDDIMGTCEDYYETDEFGESLDAVFYSTYGSEAVAAAACVDAGGTWISGQ